MSALIRLELGAAALGGPLDSEHPIATPLGARRGSVCSSSSSRDLLREL